jgi:cellulose synthase/poly-beta-1,6-N-acetylglucosamine synthase-like glycosyltransferase
VTDPLVLALGASCVMMAYVFVGYPLLLRVVVRVRGKRPIRSRDITPSVSLVISAYNEAPVIRAKLENALSLDYPAGALEIVVVSDASTDNTDKIVSQFAPRGVRLIRFGDRRGKTAGLNRALPMLRGELVVFSDANAMYEPDALRKLARNFGDPEVGCVTGEARYLPGRQAVADVGERIYWDYEIQIKRLETQLGSMVGGDGAIYAIRRELWQELPEDAINDFLNPLQIVAAGWRAVYEPAAICYEESAGNVRSEYRRRIRIVSRSWRAVFQARAVLNPFRVGFFTWSLVSHKMLRWLSGAAAVVALAAAVGVAGRSAARPVMLVVAALIAVVTVAAASARGRHVMAMLGYFAVLNAASLVGVVKGTTGRVSGVWSPPRERPAGPVPTAVLIPVGVLVAAGALLLGAVIVATSRLAGLQGAAALVFWSSAAVLAYVYAGYPVVIGAWTMVGTRPVRTAPIEPTVCLFIAANDEAEVIEAKLVNSLALDYPADRLDIVVASDGSIDGTNAIVQHFAPRVRLLEFAPRRGKTSTINEGMRRVRSEIVIFSDANTFLDPDAVRTLVRNFADPAVGAVSGDVALVGERAALAASEDLYYRYERWIQQAESRIGSMIGADGALYAVRRTLFVPPDNDTILDDLAIPMSVIRSGRRVVFEGGARAWEQGSETAREEFARKSRVVAGAVQFLARADSTVPLATPQVILSLLSHKALRWLSPAFAACAFTASVMLADSSRGYAAAAAAQLALLILGLAGCIPAFRRWNVVAVAHYFCLVQVAAAVGFARGLTGRQSVLWRRFERVTAGAALRAQP